MVGFRNMDLIRMTDLNVAIGAGSAPLALYRHNGEEYLLPVCPIAYGTTLQRLMNAWLGLRGRARAIQWPEHERGPGL